MITFKPLPFLSLCLALLAPNSASAQSFFQCLLSTSLLATTFYTPSIYSSQNSRSILLGGSGDDQLYALESLKTANGSVYYLTAGSTTDKDKGTEAFLGVHHTDTLYPHSFQLFSSQNRTGSLNDLATDSKANFTAVGYTNAFSSGNSYDGYVLQGGIAGMYWEATLGNPAAYDRFNAVIKLQDGSDILVGNRNNYQAGNRSDLLILQLVDRHIGWAYTLHNVENGQTVDADDTYIYIGGTTQSYSNRNQEENGFILKLTHHGGFVDMKVVNTSSSIIAVKVRYGTLYLTGYLKTVDEANLLHEEIVVATFNATTLASNSFYKVGGKRNSRGHSIHIYAQDKYVVTGVYDDKSLGVSLLVLLFENELPSTTKVLTGFKEGYGHAVLFDRFGALIVGGYATSLGPSEDSNIVIARISAHMESDCTQNLLISITNIGGNLSFTHQTPQLNPVNITLTPVASNRTFQTPPFNLSCNGMLPTSLPTLLPTTSPTPPLSPTALSYPSRKRKGMVRDDTPFLLQRVEGIIVLVGLPVLIELFLLYAIFKVIYLECKKKCKKTEESHEQAEIKPLKQHIRPEEQIIKVSIKNSSIIC